MWQLFTENSTFQNKARSIAFVWTLLIFILCLMPGNDIPNVNIPFVDKWTHFVLFGTFAFLWLCGFPKTSFRRFAVVFMLSVFIGSLIEYLQGAFPSLGRDMEFLDIVADGMGAVIGILVFNLFAIIAAKKLEDKHSQ